MTSSMIARERFGYEPIINCRPFMTAQSRGFKLPNPLVGSLDRALSIRYFLAGEGTLESLSEICRGPGLTKGTAPRSTYSSLGKSKRNLKPNYT